MASIVLNTNIAPQEGAISINYDRTSVSDRPRKKEYLLEAMIIKNKGIS